MKHEQDTVDEIIDTRFNRGKARLFSILDGILKELEEYGDCEGLPTMRLFMITVKKLFRSIIYEIRKEMDWIRNDLKKQLGEGGNR